MIELRAGRNSLSQNLTVLPAPSGREPLARPQTLHFSRKLCRYAKGPILEGAVAEGDWGSLLCRKLLFFPQRRAFVESGAATAACRYDPSGENAFGALRRACRGKAPPSANADRSAA